MNLVYQHCWQGLDRLPEHPQVTNFLARQTPGLSADEQLELCQLAATAESIVLVQCAACSKQTLLPWDAEAHSRAAAIGTSLC